MTRLAITEADWQRTVVDLARALGWAVAHFRAARTEQGWRTAVQYDAAGWPDLTLVRERLIVAELKSSRGRISADQQAWLDRLSAAGVPAYLWRPEDIDEVEELLRGGR